MNDYTTKNIRNVAVVGHGKTGKTSLLEACLFNSGATKRLGSVDTGTGVLDYEAEEEKRKMTIGDSLAVCEWKNSKINFIDTPGYPDFVGDVIGALTAVDSALIVVSAPAGVEVETEKVWNLAEQLKLPRAFFINKMDREHADFHKCVEALRAKFGNNVIPIQIPVGREDSFKSVINLVSKANIPAELEDEVEEAHMQMIEAAVDVSDELAEKYLMEEELTEAEINAAIAVPRIRRQRAQKYRRQRTDGRGS